MKNHLCGHKFHENSHQETVCVYCGMNIAESFHHTLFLAYVEHVKRVNDVRDVIDAIDGILLDLPEDTPGHKEIDEILEDAHEKLYGVVNKYVQ